MVSYLPAQLYIESLQICLNLLSDIPISSVLSTVPVLPLHQTLTEEIIVLAVVRNNGITLLQSILPTWIESLLFSDSESVCLSYTKRSQLCSLQ